MKIVKTSMTQIQIKLRFAYSVCPSDEPTEWRVLLIGLGCYKHSLL